LRENKVLDFLLLTLKINKQKEFTLVDNLRLSNHYLELLNVTNEFECFKICRNNENCKAASFHLFQAKLSCRLFNSDLNSKEEAHWVSYIKKPNSFSHKNPNNYKIISNLRLQNHYISTNVSNELECFQACTLKPECKAASYNHEISKSECFLFKSGFTSKEATLWISYIKIGNVDQSKTGYVII